ncbi:hypothetical protein FQN57_005407 [Myotisia sp. PD_48]|nr:hypothetical protein FQN57_005407 [Myotisia sp. PD_48]
MAASIAEDDLQSRTSSFAQFQDGKARLGRALTEKEPTFAEVERLLIETRISGQRAIFGVLEAKSARNPRDKDVQVSRLEGQLWEVHVDINSRFRKLLFNIQEGEKHGKKRPVEKRKLVNHYAKYIKSSQEFYQRYIYNLLDRFQHAHIPEFDEVAKQKKFIFDGEKEKITKSPVSKQLKLDLISSCHAALIRLGDLGRYYQTELYDQPKKNWDRAIQNYSLASLVYPSSGLPYNQFALIALAEDDHLSAIYYLYRALCTKEPHPNARKNLTKEFKKVLTPSVKEGIPPHLLSFITFHAQFFHGGPLDSDKVVNEILSHVAQSLRGESLSSSLLQKISILNIAAETCMEDSNAQRPMRRFNIAFFCVLLDGLLHELQNGNVSNLTPILCCIFPSLRQYSSWLSVHAQSLTATLEFGDRQLWKSYADALTALNRSFEILEMPEIDYLLPEDEEILGFSPLEDDATLRRFIASNGDSKLRSSSTDDNLSEDAEMRYRIREFVVDALALIVDETIPIVLLDDPRGQVFALKDGPLPPPEAADRFQHTGPASQPQIINQVESRRPAVLDTNMLDDDTSVPVPAGLRHMVDSLVEPDVPQDENSIPAQSPRSPLSVGPGFDSPAGVNPIQSYSPRPALPSILNTAFAPQPSDAISPRIRPSITMPTDSPHLLSTDGRLSAHYSFLLDPKTALHPSPYSNSSIEDYTSAMPSFQTPRLASPGGHAFGPRFPAAQSPTHLGHFVHNGYPAYPSYSYSSSNRPSSRSNVGIIGQQIPHNGQGG